MKRFLAPLAGVVIAASALVAPAASAAVADESYLFVVDSSDIEVIPVKGNVAKVVVTGPQVTRFTDRPERDAQVIGVRGMLREFGWAQSTKRLKDSTPNASVSIAGQRSQIVDIKRARISDGQLILRVRGIGGPLTAAQGVGSLFVDNATTFPQSQTVRLMDVSAISPGGPPVTTALVTLTSETTATVVLDMSSFGEGLAPRTFEIELGKEFDTSWEIETFEYLVLIDSDVTSNSASVNISLSVGTLAYPLSANGDGFFIL